MADYLLEGKFNKENCLSYIRQHTRGANRAGKLLKQYRGLIQRNEAILEMVHKQLGHQGFVNLPISDRRVLLLCLFSNSFPIAYDILVGLARTLKVQDTVSKEVIVRKIGAMYGSNRAVHIGITETLPLLLECGIIKRLKPGFYGLGSKLSATNKFICELIVYTDIKLSGSKSVLLGDLGQRPWFVYFEWMGYRPETSRTLVERRDGEVGKGYLSIKAFRLTK